jgi:hypothetical protein
MSGRLTSRVESTIAQPRLVEQKKPEQLWGLIRIFSCFSLLSRAGEQGHGGSGRLSARVESADAQSSLAARNGRDLWW